jgi:hypothetical protein
LGAERGERHDQGVLFDWRLLGFLGALGATRAAADAERAEVDAESLEEFAAGQGGDAEDAEDDDGDLRGGRVAIQAQTIDHVIEDDDLHGWTGLTITNTAIVA